MRVLIACVLATSTACARSQSQSADAAAAMLFAGYETVAKAEVAALPFDAFGAVGSSDRRGALLIPFGYLFAALDKQQPKAAERAMSQTAIVLGGMREFRGPAGLGGVSSRNCYVLIVKRGFDLAHVLGTPATERWEGLPVWRWNPKIFEFGESDAERPSTLVALQMPPYVIVSNDPDTIFANARVLQTKPRLVPGQLKEWELVTPHKYWVYRRFRFDAPDPMAAGVDRLRKDAESLILIYDKGDASARIRLAARGPVASGPESLGEDGRVPLQPVSERAWEAQVPLSGGEDVFESWFFVLYMLGFGVYP